MEYSNQIKQVGEWLENILSPKELKTIFEHGNRLAEPESKVIISVDITLYELNLLKMGYLPDKRNCFEIGH